MPTALLTLLTLVVSVVHGQNSCDQTTFDDSLDIALGNALSLNYQVNGERICIRMRSSEGTFLSIGVSSTNLMVNPTPNHNAVVYSVDDPLQFPQVYLLSGRSTAQVVLDPASESILPHSASTVNGQLEMTFDRALLPTEASDVEISLTQPTFILFAYGTNWPISSHNSGGRGVAQLQFRANRGGGGSSEDDVTLVKGPFITTLTVPIALGAIVFLCVIGALVHHTAIRTTTLGHAMLQFRMGQPPVNKRHVLHTLTLDFFPSLLDFKWGEFMVVLIYILTNIVVVTNVYESFDGQGPSTVLSMATGHVAGVNLMFLMLPISKWPVWKWAFGISVDRVIKFHRILARLFLIAATAHLVLSYETCGLLSTDSCRNQNVVPAYGFLAFVAFASMALLAIEPVRRRLYEVFFFYHKFAAIVGLAFAILHSETLSLILIAPIAVYVIGFCRRLQGFFNCTRIGTVVTSRDVIFVQLETSNQTVKWSRSMSPGSFFWICNPEVSKTQWHPFSAITSPTGNTIGFALKKGSNNSYVSRFVQTLSHTGSGGKLYVDGPYGELSINPREYQSLVLIAGGIGITPLLSIINQSKWNTVYKSVQHLTLIWTVRSPKDLLCCDEYLFSSWSNDADNVYVSIQTPGQRNTTPREDSMKREFRFYVSSASSSGSVASKFRAGRIKYKAGRPNFSHLTKKGSNTAVIACGPEPMLDDAQRMASANRFDFHKEVFNW